MLKRTEKLNNKIMFAAFCMAIIVLSYIVAEPQMVLVGLVLICILILSSSVADSNYILLFTISSSQIVTYQETGYFIVVVLAYILNTMLKGRFAKGTIYMIVMLLYSVVFANPNVPLVIGSLTSVFYIVVAVFLCENTAPENMRNSIKYYSEGVGLAMVIGVISKRVPELAQDYEVNYLSRSTSSLTRFNGIYSDPSVVTAIICIAVAAIIFTTKKLQLRQLMLISFLVVIGFFTFSKSYILTLAALAVIYTLKSGRNIFRNIMIISCVGVAFLLVEQMRNMDLLSIVLSRFDRVENVNELTTGRWKIWEEYIKYIFSDLRVLLFGDGFNAMTVFPRFGVFRNTHNVFLEFLFRYGIVGCTLWTACFKSCYNAVAYEDDIKRPQNTIIPLLTVWTIYFFMCVFKLGFLGVTVSVAYFAMFVPPEDSEEGTVEKTLLQPAQA